MTDPGYHRFPTIQGSTLVFVCEDDLWTVSDEGGLAHRLTAHQGETSHPVLAPDGRHLAFIAREEGPPEVYVMPMEGGPSRRLTFLGSANQVVGWEPGGRRIVFASDHGQPFRGVMRLFAIPPGGGLPELLPFGSAHTISYGSRGRVVLGRHTRDPARWKRYRGGTSGQVWIDPDGKRVFRRLLDVHGNVSSPMMLGERVFFLSDHEGIGNLYSVTHSGGDLRRHTDHDEFYARNASTDGSRIVYHCGADLFVHDPGSDTGRRLEVRIQSSRTQRNRKFIDSSRFFEDYHPHPKGHSVALTIRGRVHTGPNFEGPIVSHGEPDGVRYRLGRWLNDGRRIVTLSDAGGEEALEVHHTDGSEAPVTLPRLPVGRPLELRVSPVKDQVAFPTHRGELVVCDLATRNHRVLDRSRHGRLLGFDWSPDGRWIAYGFRDSPQTSCLKVVQVATGRSQAVTRPVLLDMAPSFDPEGKYLYFISHRVFDPVYDAHHFELGFPRGTRPYLLTLQGAIPSPFATPLTEPEEPAKPGSGNDPKKGRKPAGPAPVRIDFEGIEDRIVAFPAEEGRYEQIIGLPQGKVFYTTAPIEGSLSREYWEGTVPPARLTLHRYDLQEKKPERWLEHLISSMEPTPDRKTLFYRAGRKLRVLTGTEKPKSDGPKDPPGRKSGWLDLDRVRVSVRPTEEWRQMYREAWRLQRDHFWSEDMSGVDWELIFRRYRPLVDRVGSRCEFSDLMWEMQGELSTSHAYEFGGEYRRGPWYRQGVLGAEVELHAPTGGYRVTSIAHGDPWDADACSGLRAPGIDIRPGDVLLAIGGRRLTPETTPHELLVNQAGRDVLVEVVRGRGKPRRLPVRVLTSDTGARYRDWVETNRGKVHDATAGRVGYVHVPNMGPVGYAEFHRYYLVENSRDALIVDVRYNGGGHVSQLILEKLVRRRIGYSVPRWGEPEPYPLDSVLGPIVAVTNELAGSDGDIFSHSFKLLGLGPLIGRRTWGGVIGIWPRHLLVDGTVTTQPEFSFWFQDVGWGVENYGTDPDIEVDIAPHQEVRGEDPQLDRAIAEVLGRLEAEKPSRPSFGDRPCLVLPRLPARKKDPAPIPPATRKKPPPRRPSPEPSGPRRRR